MPHPTPPPVPNHVCVGVVVGAHGLKGQVKVKSFCANPADILSFKTFATVQQQSLSIISRGGGGENILLGFAEHPTRTAAEKLRGTYLYVPTSALPELADDEFYVGHLIGLSILSPTGTVVGQVDNAFDAGGGLVLESGRKATVLFHPDYAQFTADETAIQLTPAGLDLFNSFE